MPVTDTAVAAGGVGAAGDEPPPPQATVNHAVKTIRLRRAMEPKYSGASDMRIGVVCYATVGGSGVVATELAHALARRGHEIHLISAELPFRWRWATRGLAFERVEIPSYPLFREPQYLLALTNTIVRVCEQHQLDIVHAHYAVPHATGAYLAQHILSERI